MNADEQRLLGVADSLVVLLGVVFDVRELLPVLVVEPVVGAIVSGDLVDSVGLVIVPSHHDGAKESLLKSGAKAGISSASHHDLLYLVEDGVGPEDLVVDLAAEQHLLLVLADTGHVARLMLSEGHGGLGVEVVTVDELQLLHSSPQHDVEEGLGRGGGTGSKSQLPYWHTAAEMRRNIITWYQIMCFHK